MNERESGSGSEDTEFERHAPQGSQPGGGQPNSGRPATDDARAAATSGVDETEREVVTSGTAATSEIADEEAQSNAEGQGDGTPLPR